MRAIKNSRIIDFLWENGLKPEYEICGTAFYHRGAKLARLMDRYYIQTVCIPNNWRY